MRRALLAAVFAIASCGDGDSSAVDGGLPGDDAAVDASADADTRTTVDLFLIVGQSNAVGFGAGPGAIEVPVAGAHEFDTSTGSLAPLAYPTGLPAGNYWSSHDTGFVVALAHRWRELSGHVPVVVCRGKGATALLDATDTGNGDWTDSVDADGLFEEAVAAFAAAGESIASDPTLRIGGRYLVWHQGETEGEAGIAAETYRDGLSALLDRFGERAPFDAFFVSEIGYRLPSDPTAIARYDEISRGIGLTQDVGRHIELVSQLPRMLTAPCLIDAGDAACGLADAFHYTTAAYEALGTDIADNAWQYVSTR